MQHPNKNKAFSLLELLIVITVIAILIGVLLPNLNEARIKARDQRRKADIRSIIQSLETYKLNQSPPSYPATSPFTAVGQAWVDGGVTYMNVIPTDPLYQTDTSNYIYRYYRDPADTLKYYVGSCIEDVNDPEAQLSPPSGPTWSGCTYWYYRSEP